MHANRLMRRPRPTQAIWLKRIAIVLIVCAAVGIQSNRQVVIANTADPIEKPCNDIVSSPDFTVRLAFPTSIPPEQYDEVQSKVLQRVNIFGLEACSVERDANNRIVVKLAVGPYFRVSAEEIEDILSRRGFVEIVDANRLDLEAGLDLSTIVVEAQSSPTSQAPTYSVLATNDDIDGAFPSGMPDGSNGVIFKLSGRGAELFSQFSRENAGNEIAIIADGNIIWTATIDGDIEPRQEIWISGLELEEAIALTFYLASESYPAALCVLGLADPATQTPDAHQDSCR